MFVAGLSSQSEVRRLAAEVVERLPPLDVLVDNVGGYWHARHLTVDGLERTFALNHLAPFLLTNLLLDRLGRSPAAQWSPCPPTPKPWAGSTSTTCRAARRTPATRLQPVKLANLLFTYELARRLHGTSVTANAVHPGVVNTSFGGEDPPRSNGYSSRSCDR